MAMTITSGPRLSKRIQRGEKKKHKDLPEDTVIIPIEYKLILSDLRMKDRIKEVMKEEGISEEEASRKVERTYFVKLTYLAILPDNDKPMLYHSTESSEEIVQFYILVKQGKEKLNQRLHLGVEGNKLFYKEFHVTAKDAVDYLTQLDGIKELIY